MRSQPKPLSLSTWAVLAVVLAAFGLSAAVSRAPFERLPHLEDEVTYLWQARLFASGQITMPSPAPRQSYWQPFVIDYQGQRFGKYPPGWPLLLAAGVLLGQPWIVNSFLAALTVALTYRLGRAIFDAPTGLLGALLTAASPTFLLLSGSLMNHTASTFWGLVMACAFWRLARRPGRRPAALGGLALGILISTRPLTAAGLLLPFAVAATLTARTLYRRLRHQAIALPLRRAAGLAAILIGCAALAASPLPLHNAAATGDATANLYQFVWEYDQIGFGPDHGRYGHTPEGALRNMRQDLSLWSSDLFGWQMSPAFHDWLAGQTGWQLGAGISWLLLPIGLAASRRNPWAWLLSGMFLGLVAVHLLYWIGAQTYSARYYAEAIPALALISAAGVRALAGRFPARLIYGLLLAALSVSLLTYTPPRLAALWRLNDIGRDDIAALEDLRDGRPVLMLVTGAERRSWREWGTYMALTSPDLMSDVVAAREHGWPGELDAILARFPDRQIIILPPDGLLRPYGR